jgi:ubiquinone/menaquinone biosynthesis C-methylase UbiE
MSKELYNKQYYLNCKKFQLGRSRFTPVIKQIMKFSPKRVLDVGCGLGTLVKCLRERGIEAIGVDFAQTLKDDFDLSQYYFLIVDAKKLPFEDKSFDVVVSTDFFEHLSEKEIDIVLGEMNRVGRVVIARVAYKAELNLRQKKLHLTNKPKSWWEKKLNGVILI